MKRMVLLGLIGLAFSAPGGAAWAEYERSSEEPEGAPQKTFREAVDLSRFRKGNLEWDTQELIVSGLTALHEENTRMLNRLEQIQSRLDRIERERRTEATIGGSR